ncbi:hypothetical protein CDD80_2458 [Ophiocordyceps camponoti-rufipedis]|uniref:DUF7924 domain-containing protein n=1 Tax=Ophiocordyceps camponoti-rufipedis TaxID=2004952 RepID=A0A2C5Z2S5_9HYPO|nr:hypothetical protein CDD80_2458 [Ophiocordyceps camponoti-rufipedis]
MVQTRAQARASARPKDHGESRTLKNPSSKIKTRGTKRSADVLHDDIDIPRKRPSPPADQATNPVAFWVRKGNWPREYFELDMSHLHAQKRGSSLPRKLSTIASYSVVTPSDEKPREIKTAPYRDPCYEILLGTKGSYMVESDAKIPPASKEFCTTLLETPQSTPKDSLFNEDVFQIFCEKLRTKNEARVIQDISRLIVPSAETLAIRGAKHLEILIESVNEGWNNSIPLLGPRPQPDYSVGFRREAFTKKQLEKLAPFIGDYIEGDQSYFMATYDMCFPFLTCEVECGGMFVVADRHNAHSMTLAVRAVAELFSLVKRAEDVNRQILGFSFSHDDRHVRIYGHYPVIQGKNIKYYRHAIHAFDITVLDGKEKWTAYRFTKNLYELWMPQHHKRICSAIDQVPDVLLAHIESQSQTEEAMMQPGQSEPILEGSRTDGSKRRKGETGE